MREEHLRQYNYITLTQSFSFKEILQMNDLTFPQSTSVIWSFKLFCCFKVDSYPLYRSSHHSPAPGSNFSVLWYHIHLFFFKDRTDTHCVASLQSCPCVVVFWPKGSLHKWTGSSQWNIRISCNALDIILSHTKSKHLVRVSSVLLGVLLKKTSL